MISERSAASPNDSKHGIAAGRLRHKPWLTESLDTDIPVNEPRQTASETLARQTGIVLTPEVLQGYKAIDEDLPALIIRTIDNQLEREYRYAVGGQIVAGCGLLLVIAGFIYLVLQSHAAAAAVLLGAGVLGFLSGVIRARLIKN